MDGGNGGGTQLCPLSSHSNPCVTNLFFPRDSIQQRLLSVCGWLSKLSALLFPDASAFKYDAPGQSQPLDYMQGKL